MIDGFRVRKGLRSAVIAAGTFGLMYYGLEGTNGVLAGLLALIGAVTVGFGWAKIWPEPENK
jgi:hypothetical protein